jgi:hypothetical protein
MILSINALSIMTGSIITLSISHSINITLFMYTVNITTLIIATLITTALIKKSNTQLK